MVAGKAARDLRPLPSSDLALHKGSRYPDVMLSAPPDYNQKKVREVNDFTI
jgi:hypothetical protein